MRITNKMLANNFLSDMQLNLQNLSKIQQQMSSMKNFSKPSDDPFNVVRSMQLNTDINANSQYKTNITTAVNFMDTTDTALGQMGTVLSGIRDKLVSSGNAAYGSDERSKIKDEVNQRISQIAQLLNTSFQGDYIFAGTRGLSKPVMTEDYTVESPQVETNAPFDASEWSGNITFSITSSSGEIKTGTVTLDGSYDNVNDAISALNTKLQADPNLKDKISVSRTEDGGIKFTSEDSSTIKIEDTTIKNADIVSFKQNLNGKTAAFNADEWQGTVDIDFSVDGKEVPVSIDCSSLPDPPTIEAVTAALNAAIGDNTDLSGKLEVTADGGKLKFGIPTSATDIEIEGASTLSLSALEGRNLAAESSDSENISIKYLGIDGSSLSDIPSVQTDGVDLSSWKGQTITFTLDQEAPLEDISSTVSIPADPTEEGAKSTINTVDDLVKTINDQIQSGSLKDKVTAVKTDDGNIKFLAVSSSDNISITDTSIDDLSALQNKQFSSVEMNNISSKRKMEVSKGVVVEYNACATDILQYGTGSEDNTAALLDRIVHHLAGQIEDGAGGWKDDEDAATEALTNDDLSDIDKASKQLLKVRSEVGAKANRMESLSDQNDDTKINMTEVLSKTEDIDITEKTIEYYTMSTVYTACLQTSARVIQPTLMDYIN